MSWFDWDRCPRIRAAVVDLFVERDLAPDIFLRLALDDRLFMMLAEAAARSGRGRQYLKRVRRLMKDESEVSPDHRLRRLERLLR